MSTESSPTATDAHGRGAFERARAHGQAAASLLDDAAVPPWTAATHLRRGWSALVDAAGADADDPAQALAAGAVPWVDDPEPIAAALARVDDDGPADAATLLRLSTALGRALGRAQDERFAPTLRRDRRHLWLRRLGMAVLVLIPVVVALVLTVPDYREGPWRAAYFDNVELTGDPVLVRRDGDIKYDWKRRSPDPALPDDGFSIRWDTCMELSEDLEIAFQLISDDGSRLYVDGEEVVDNWGRHGERSRGGERPLAAGMHHVRVEYFDERHAASVELRASLRGELPDALPVRILHYPGDTLDEDDPCAGVGD
ncbi:MAG: PA14 domain-containing protein [Myxococcota bacterium]